MSGADYFTYTNLVANSLARASDVNARVAAIQGAFGKLPHYEKIREGRSTYAVDTGAVNALVATLDFAPSAYTAGLALTVKIGVTNTGAATLNVNGLGAKAIKRYDGSALAAGDLVAGHVATLVYDGTNFQLTSPAETVVASYATAASTSATNAATSATAAANSATAAANSATAAANSAAAAANMVSKSGDTMTGALTLSGAPTADLHASTKKYVDDAVFAAGSVSADEVTIHSATGVFGLVTQANNTVLGNISGGVAKPGALTQAQLTALANAVVGDSGAGGTKGMVPAPAAGDAAAGKFLKADGTWAAPSTILSNALTINNSGAGAASGATFTGAAAVTISYNTVGAAAASHTHGYTDVVSVPNNRILGNNAGSTGAAVALTAAETRTLLGLAAIATSASAADITAGTLAVARGGTGVTTSTGTGSVVLSASPALTGTPTAPTAAAATNTTQVATTAFVQTELADYALEFLTVTSISANRTLADADNNSIIFMTGSTGRTITANSTPSVGFSCILASISTVAWTFSCAGGVYVDGATSTTTSASMPAGARCTAIHKGAGVWLLSGV